MALRAGLLVGFLSGRPSKATEHRAADLGVKIVLQGPINKRDMLEEVERAHGLCDKEIAFIGDEWVDLPVLKRVGLAVAVPNAIEEVRQVAHYVTRRPGGDGAVREVIEMILKSQGSWEKTIAKYLVLVVAVLTLLPSAGLANSESNSPANMAAGYIEKFSVPQLDENGDLKWKLSGDRALLRPDGLMDIFNVRAEFYSSNRVDMVFTSPSCVLDRANDRAATDAPVRIERDNMIVTGIGGDWDGKISTLAVRREVQVVLKNGSGLLGEPENKMNHKFLSLAVTTGVAVAVVAGQQSNAADPAVPTALSSPSASTNEPTLVTADSSQLDYAKRVWTFRGNVLVVDPRITLRADKMTVFLAGTNSVSSADTNTTGAVEKIIAEEGVVITTPDNKKATSDYALYTASDGKVVLTGHPQVQSPGGLVTGTRIVFWRNQDRMDVESDSTDTNRTRLLIYPQPGGKKQEPPPGP